MKALAVAVLATALLMAPARGSADGIRGDLVCVAEADVEGCSVAVSTQGDAACDGSVLRPCIAASGFGDATCSGGHCAAASLAGNASAKPGYHGLGMAATVVGDSSCASQKEPFPAEQCAALSAFGDAPCAGSACVAATVTGDARGFHAVSVTGHAEGNNTVSVCGVVGAACFDPL